MDASFAQFREDAMRRLLLSTVGLLPLALLCGCCCNHLAGKCDCDRTPTLACPCYNHAVVAPPPVKAPETPPDKMPDPLKETPKPKPEPDKE
jgi:hypothetical protein